MGLKRCLDHPRRSNRVFGAAYRTPDNQHAGTVVARLTRGDDALLIADTVFGHAQSRDDEKSVLPLIVHGLYLAA